MTVTELERPVDDLAPASYPTPPDDEKDDDDDKARDDGGQYTIFRPPTTEPTAIAVQVWYGDGSSRTVMLEPFPVEENVEVGGKLGASVEWLRATRHDASAILTGGAMVTVMPWAIPHINILGRLRSFRAVDADGRSQVIDEAGLVATFVTQPDLPLPTLWAAPDEPDDEGTDDEPAADEPSTDEAAEQETANS